LACGWPGRGRPGKEGNSLRADGGARGNAPGQRPPGGVKTLPISKKDGLLRKGISNSNRKKGTPVNELKPLEKKKKKGIWVFRDAAIDGRGNGKSWRARQV